MFARAGQPELVRANQKDVYYQAFVRDNLGQIFRNFRGPHSWIRWKSELDLLADLCYFGLTTLCGFQTLGEEYCNVIQVDHTLREVPSSMRRGVLIFCHVAGYYLLDKVLRRLEHMSSSSEHWPSGFNVYLRQLLHSVTPIVRQLVVILHRAHLTMFYLTGFFYHIAKRVTGIQYFLVRSSLKDKGPRPTYRLLGYLSVLQLTITLLVRLYKVSALYKTLKKPKNNRAESLSPMLSRRETCSPKLKCSLCLEQVRDMTATPCGHIFCWQCIAEWCGSKAECPLCREQVQLSRLVYLHHFEPS